MPGSRWSRNDPRLTAPPICKKPPQPPLAPLPPCPTYVLAAVSLAYGPGTPHAFQVGGFVKCWQAGPFCNFVGDLYRGGQHLGVRVGVDPINGQVVVRLEGSLVIGPGPIAESAPIPIVPGTAWTAEATAWTPDDPNLHASATISN